MLFLLTVVLLAPPTESIAQDIRTALTAFDNLGHSRIITIGISSSATDGIDFGLGEFPLPPPLAGNFDARIIDNDLRSPSLLGNGVWLDLRGIYTAPPIVQRYEVQVRRAAGASFTYLAWSIPLSAGITSAFIAAFPDPSVLSADMTAQSQVLLPAGVNRYIVTVSYGGPVLQRWVLNTGVSPAGSGAVLKVPDQPDYMHDEIVTLSALNLPPPDTCHVFSHWSGNAAGNNPVITIRMDTHKTVIANYIRRRFPTTASTLDTFLIGPAAPPPQTLRILGSGQNCADWTFSVSEPWIVLSKNSGRGDDSVTVMIRTSEIPCQGTHAGKITLTSAASFPRTIEVPVIARIGRSDVTASVLGSPVLLSCEPYAQDLIAVTLYNESLTAVSFPSQPAPGPGFILKNPELFPLSIPPRDSARLYFEFRPLPEQRGAIVDNIIMTATSCGRQTHFKLQGTRIAPTVSADIRELEFGIINSCETDPLPERVITLFNAHSAPAQLRYALPSGFLLTSAPASIPPGGTLAVTLQAKRAGAADIAAVFGIEADFGVCRENIEISLTGRREDPSFLVEAAATPGALPPQVFDSICVGEYSAPKYIRVVNTGTSELSIVMAAPQPFEVDAFSASFELPPGGHREVELRFHPLAAGSFSDTLSITADRCDLARSVSLQGATFSQQFLDASLQPAAIVLADCEDEGRMLLRVTNTGSQAAVFSELPPLPEGFFWDPSLALPVSIQPGPASAFETWVTFRPPAGRHGEFGGSVNWIGSPCGTSAAFRLTGSRIIPQVSIAPAALDFGRIISCDTASTGISKTVRVGNASSLPVLLVASAPASRYRVLLSGTDFPTQGVVIPPSSEQIFEVQALPGGGGRFADSLTVMVFAGATGSCSERRSVALSGERYRPAFVLHEKTEEADFARTCVGETTIRHWTLENTGDMPLLISSDGFPPGAPFSLTTRPYRITLQPGATADFAVRFKPPAMGMYAAAVSLRSDGCPGELTLDLTGNGIQPRFEITSLTPPGPVTVLTCETSISRQFRATVTNTGADIVVIADGSVPPEGFVWDPPGQFPFTLQPAASKEVILRLAASAPGAYGGEIRVYGDPCGTEQSFPVNAVILPTSFTVSPAEFAFGALTICPSGSVVESDREKLVKEAALYNTGAVPLIVSAETRPLSAPFRILRPASWPVIIQPGFSEAPDTSLAFVTASLELAVERPDSACLPERVSIPVTARFQRIGLAFLRDSVTATISCSAETAALPVTLLNTGTAPATVRLELSGSASFTVTDTLRSIIIPPGRRVEIPVLFSGTAGRDENAVLKAIDEVCGFETSIALSVRLLRTDVTLSCGKEAGISPALEALPGAILEVPLYLSGDVSCGGLEMEFSGEVGFNGFNLAPVGIRTVRGGGIIERKAPDKALVTIVGTDFRAGLIGTLLMEVLVGKDKLSGFELRDPGFSPSVGLLSTDQNCSATVRVRPRFGVSTWYDLGISQLLPPRPNVLLQSSSSAAVISFELARDAHAELAVYDGLGNRVSVLHSGQTLRGPHTAEFAPTDLPAGVYIITLNTGGEFLTQKLIVAR